MLVFFSPYCTTWETYCSYISILNVWKSGQRTFIPLAPYRQKLIWFGWLHLAFMPIHILRNLGLDCLRPFPLALNFHKQGRFFLCKIRAQWIVWEDVRWLPRTIIVSPQSQLQNQYCPCLGCLWCFSRTVSSPNFFPTRSSLIPLISLPKECPRLAEGAPF